jgi:hypothetical protein
MFKYKPTYKPTEGEVTEPRNRRRAWRTPHVILSATAQQTEALIGTHTDGTPGHLFSVTGS